MAFPDDLSDVVAFKIHPAIGIARVAKNEDYFVFGTQPATYKSNGLMKRQAVQFRVFAYGADNVGLGELTKDVMTSIGVGAVWSAQVANRKLELTAREQNVPDPAARVFGATAASDDEGGGKLVATLPNFAEGGAIPLGEITGDGLFLPPLAGVFREALGTPIPSYPNFTPGIADTTSDGIIRVALDGPAADLPVLSAWIVVAPGDYSPDVDPEPVAEESLLVHLKELVASNSGSTGTIHNETARRIDETSIQPASADWLPGFEVSFGSRSNITNLKSIFYDSASDPLIDPREMRIRPKTAAAQAGAQPGQLTSGLCSPWQTDFTACVGYWSENLPRVAYLDEALNTQVSVYRKSYDDKTATAPRLTSGDDFDRHQDKIGVVRLRSSKEVETEREPGDDIG